MMESVVLCDSTVLVIQLSAARQFGERWAAGAQERAVRGGERPCFFFLTLYYQNTKFRLKTRQISSVVLAWKGFGIKGHYLGF